MIHHIEQNTPEWHQLRCGVITASHFDTIMANEGKAFGEPAKKYACKIALEMFTKTPIESEYKNSHMDRGHEQEPIARLLYELHHDQVQDGGFATDGIFGASSDGLVGEQGMIEIKSVVYNVHFDRLKKGGINNAYEWQIVGAMWQYNRSWCDFVQFCADFPSHKQLYVFRVERDLEREQRLLERLGKFNELVMDNYNLLIS